MNSNFNLPPGCSSSDPNFGSHRPRHRARDNEDFEPLTPEESPRYEESATHLDFTDVDHDG